MKDTLIESLVSFAGTESFEQYVVGAIVRHGNNVLFLKRPDSDFMRVSGNFPAEKSNRTKPVARKQRAASAAADILLIAR